MIKNNKIKTISLLIGMVIVLSVFASFTFDIDSFNYQKNFEKNYRSNLNLSNSGNWDPADVRSVGDNPNSVFIGDANNDGYNDIVTANFDHNNVSILLWNTTSGDWDSQITRTTGTDPWGIYIGDANNDGFNDIVTTNYNDMSVSIILWNDTSTSWDTLTIRPVKSLPIDVFIGDANNDGFNDIVTANSWSFANTISILLWNTTSLDWDSQILKPVGTSPRGISIGDANNDGKNDIITANSDSNTVSILQWNTTSLDWDSQILKPVGTSPRGISIGDTNNDGYNDIVTANAGGNSLSILLWNLTSGDWNSQITRSVGTSPSSVFIGDANNDGFNDIAVACNNINVLLWNITSSNWDSAIVWTTGLRPIESIIGDANNDGYNDIVTAIPSADSVTILLWNIAPQIIINLPTSNKLFGNKAPTFDLIIIDDNLDTTWYTLDGGLTSYTFVGTNGTINQGTWSAQPNGTVTIRFYANDTLGSLNFSEVTVRKDVSKPIIQINTPSFNQLFGITAPNYNVEIKGQNLGTFWYTLDGGATNYTFIANDTINPAAWDIQPNGTVTIAFYANNSLGNIGFNEVTVRKDIDPPEISIDAPNPYQVFTESAPYFEFTIVEGNLDQIWYTIDGGLTNYTRVNTSGIINQGAWDAQPNGTVTIRFYANDTLGNLNFSQITVRKDVILPSIIIISPNSTSTWQTGNSYDILWNSPGLIPNVKIELHLFGPLLMVITPSTPNNGSFTWIVPTGLMNSTIYKIRIIDVLDATMYNESDYFEIYTPYVSGDWITITNPLGFVSWETNTTYSINWNAIGSIVNVKIELYRNGILETLISTSTPNNGSYLWTIPSGLVYSTLYQIKITDVSNSSTYGLSSYFEIYTPYVSGDWITITNPLGFVTWEINTTYSINWTTTGSITMVKIELYRNGLLETPIIINFPNNGSYLWTISSGLVDSALYQIKITDHSNSSTYGLSAYFEIYTPYVPTGSITVTYPYVLVAWETSTTHSIIWTSTGSIANVKIELYKGNFLEITIISSTFNNGTHIWTIPNDLTNATNYRIKISDVSNSLIYDYSDNFIIYSSITESPTDNSTEIPGFDIFLLLGVTWVISAIIIKKRHKSTTSQ